MGRQSLLIFTPHSAHFTREPLSKCLSQAQPSPGAMALPRRAMGESDSCLPYSGLQVSACASFQSTGVLGDRALVPGLMGTTGAGPSSQPRAWPVEASLRLAAKRLAPSTRRHSRSLPCFSRVSGTRMFTSSKLSPVLGGRRRSLRQVSGSKAGRSDWSRLCGKERGPCKGKQARAVSWEFVIRGESPPSLGLVQTHRQAGDGKASWGETRKAAGVPWRRHPPWEAGAGSQTWAVLCHWLGEHI